MRTAVRSLWQLKRSYPFPCVSQSYAQTHRQRSSYIKAKNGEIMNVGREKIEKGSVLEERHDRPFPVFSFLENQRARAIENLWAISRVHDKRSVSIVVSPSMSKMIHTSSSTSCFLRGKQCKNFQSGFARSRHISSVT